VPSSDSLKSMTCARTPMKLAPLPGAKLPPDPAHRVGCICGTGDTRQYGKSKKCRQNDLHDRPLSSVVQRFAGLRCPQLRCGAPNRFFQMQSHIRDKQ